MLLAALLVAAAVSAGSGAPAPADGTYNYSIEAGSDKIGSSSVTVKRSDAGITVHETQTKGAFSFVVDEILDPSTLAHKSYIATYTKAGASQTIRVFFDRSGATVMYDRINGSSPLALPAGVKDGFIIEASLMTGFLFLPAQIHQANANQFGDLIPSQMFVFTNKVDATAKPARPDGVPKGDVSLSISGPVNYDEWYDPTTFVLHAVSVPIQNVVIRLTK